MRTRTMLLLSSTLTVVTVTSAGVASGGDATPDGARSPSAGAPTSRTGVIRAAAALSSWDTRRSAAWSHGDLAALSHLYTAGSRTGARDVADLRRWRSRHLRVSGLRQQVAELRVLVSTSDRLVLTVTDRTVDGVAVARHRRTALPTSSWATHRIRLRRERGRWLVEEVVDQPAR